MSEYSRVFNYPLDCFWVGDELLSVGDYVTYKSHKHPYTTHSSKVLEFKITRMRPKELTEKYPEDRHIGAIIVRNIKVSGSIIGIHEILTIIKK